MDNIKRDACMTVAQADGFGAKVNWWVLDVDASTDTHPEWVRIGSYRPATQTLSCTLAPGRYLLGAGPPAHYREHITVASDGSVVVEYAPCLASGCSGTVVFTQSLTSCEPFTVAPPADRLCVDCRQGVRRG